MTDPQHQLSMYKTAYTQLQHSFKNNLNVIKQLQQENTQLQRHLQQVAAKYESQLQRALVQHSERHKKQLEEQEVGFAREVELVKKEYEAFIGQLEESGERKNQQMVVGLAKKHKQDMDGLRGQLAKDLEAKHLELKKTQSRCKSLEDSLTSAESKLNDTNLKLITLQSQLQRLQHQRKQNESLHSSKEQQLQSIKQYSTSWQNTLRQRIKQLQDHKSSLQEELAEIRFTHKDKHRKMKDQMTKKIAQLEEANTVRLNETLLQSKEIRYKYEAIKMENTEAKGEVERVRKELVEARRLLEEERGKVAAVQDSLLTVKEKQFEIRSMNEEVKRLKAELKSSVEEKTTQKEELDKINYQRENAEKALERLKVELLNKSREVDQYRKEVDRVKYNKRVNEYHQGGSLDKGLNLLQERGNGLAKYDKKDAIKGQVDHSKCFSDDMGGEDFRFFQSSVQPPQPNPLNYDSSPLEQSSIPLEPSHQPHQIPHLMKRIGQLQVLNTQYLSKIRLLSQQMQRTSLTIKDKEQLKEKEIRLCKEENMLLREKVNDKEEQLMRVRQSVTEQREELERLRREAKSTESLDLIVKENDKLKQDIQRLMGQVDELREEVGDLVNERQTLEEIADQLRAEVNFYKDQAERFFEEQKQKQDQSIFKSNYSGLSSNMNIIKQGNSFLNNNLSNNYSTNQPQPPLKPQPQHNHPTRHNKFLSNNENPSSNFEQEPRVISVSPHQRPKERSPQLKAQKPKRKLHQLIRQKNQLEAEGGLIMGRKANLEKRLEEEERVEKVGTKSQKDVYERLEKKSKSKSREKSTVMKLKDFEVAKPEREREMVKDMSVGGKRASTPTPSPLSPPTHQYNSTSSNQPINTSTQQPSLIDHSAMMRRIEVMDRLKEELKNDSLGEFDHLENVSMTYWEQQQNY